MSEERTEGKGISPIPLLLVVGGLFILAIFASAGYFSILDSAVSKSVNLLGNLISSVWGLMEPHWLPLLIITILLIRQSYLKSRVEALEQKLQALLPDLDEERKPHVNEGERAFGDHNWNPIVGTNSFPPGQGLNTAQPEVQEELGGSEQENDTASPQI